jgi:hypothetical protein
MKVKREKTLRAQKRPKVIAGSVMLHCSVRGRIFDRDRPARGADVEEA